MGLLDVLLRKVIQVAGVALPERKYWNFVSGATAVDNPITGATDITIAAGGGAALPVTRTRRTAAAASNITTADDLVEVTAAASPQTLPGAPLDGHTYEVCNNTAGNNNVLGNGHNFNVTGNATFTLGPNQSLTATYSSGSLMWLAS